MLIGKPNDIPSSEITPESVYLDRRRFLQLGAAGAVGTAIGACAPDRGAADDGSGSASAQQETPTELKHITSYNNFYEFGPDKDDPSKNAPAVLKPRPWTVKVEGLCGKPGTYVLDDFIKPSRVEDRTYRLRCVEGWSMVIPWRGFPLADVIRRAEPTAQAKYVEMYTLVDPAQMPYQKTSLLEWPYIEGLRLDEAMHPLTLLATGLYGRDLPTQNGAPLRLVVPWKYGFKSVKSIVRIRFVEREPVTTWVQQNSREYGFYSNVNPNVDHPRWSQKKERRIPSLFKNVDTLIFNGYGAQVASLYEGMDLKKYY